jgi:hypothetical protein
MGRTPMAVVRWVVGFVDEFAAMEPAHERLVDLAARAVETVQIAIGWEPCRYMMVRACHGSTDQDTLLFLSSSEGLLPKRTVHWVF